MGCLQRHGISRLPDIDGDKPQKKKFKRYPIGYFHIDIAEVQTAEGKLHLFVAIDRTSKFAFVELHPRATRAIASQFLRNLVEVIPYQHTVLTAFWYLLRNYLSASGQWHPVLSSAQISQWTNGDDDGACV